MTSKPATTVRLAGDAEYTAFFGKPPPPIWTGMCAIREGRVVAFGAVAWDLEGYLPRGCFDAKEKVSPFVMHKAALKMIDALRQAGEEVLYVGCEDRPEAIKWVKRLGFEPPLPGGTAWSLMLNGVRE